LRSAEPQAIFGMGAGATVTGERRSGVPAGGSLPLMYVADARAWFVEYLNVFAALGPGEFADPRRLLDVYAVPLLLATDDAVVALTTDAEVVNAIRAHIDGLRDAGYDRSETIASELSVLNARTALYAAEFSRRRADGSELGRLAATYLITAGTRGRRISALIVRTP
jgi:hypothetical protein